MNRRDPLLGMSQNYSPWLLNIDCENQFNRVRNGVVIHSTLQDVEVVTNLGVYGSRGFSTNKLFAHTQVSVGAGDNKVYDISTSTESLSITTSVGSQSDEIRSFNFNQRLMFHGESNFANDDVLYDGSSWSTSGFTYSASPIGGRVAGSYKGRPYFAEGNYLYYPTTVGAVTGALNRQDFSSVFKFSGNIAFIATISAPGDRPTDMFFVMGNTNGEILVYGGDYPDSSTWSLVSQFKTSPLLGYEAIITYNNDLLLLTRTGAVSLRQLFIQGNLAAETLNISDPIDDYWIKLINNLTATSYWSVPPSMISGCYWPEKNRILILVPGHVDIDGVYSASYATMFSYNCATKAWSIYKLANVDATWIGGMTYFAGSVYFFTRNVVMTISSTVFKDETYNSAGSYSAYAHAQHSAYINVDSLSKGKRVQAIEPIVKTDFAGATDLGVKVASDAGRSVSQATYPTLADGYNSPYCSVGVEGTYLQYRLEGTTDVASTDGLELYAVTAILEGQGVR